MQNFKIPVEWTSYGVIEVEGDTIEQALENAIKNADELPLPDEGEYMEDSFIINQDMDLIKHLNKL